MTTLTRTPGPAPRPAPSRLPVKLPVEPPVSADRHAPVPLTGQIAAQLREALADGRLAAGERLPSTRALAATLGVSRTVVTAAYTQLFAEGWLEGRHGSGTYVAQGALGPAPAREAGPAPGLGSGRSLGPGRGRGRGVGPVLARPAPPGPDEVLVRVLAAGVGPWDASLRRGGWTGPLPYIQINGTAGSAQDAVAITNQTAVAFIAWFKSKQVANQIDANSRVVVEQVNSADHAIAGGGSKPLLGVAAALFVLLGASGLALAL